MEVELITIGDEIITGHTIDTNAAYMASRLVDNGFIVRYRTSVGDNAEDMEEAFRQALKRVEIVIVTGGLGPTDDDVTKRSIVKVFKRNLIFHEDILEDIRARYSKRGIEMPAINQNQALLPQGATFFPNKNGSAVGICIAEHGRVFIALPGVPFEMMQILDDYVIPYLRNLGARQAIKVTRVRTTGIVESRIAEMIVPDLKLDTGVRLAYLPGYRGVDLRVIASAETQDQADEKARALVRYLEDKVGRYVYGYDEDTLESVVGQLLRDNDRTLAVAESCTGGLLGAAVTSVPGSSAYFRGGILAYSDAAKTRQLGVPPEVIGSHGAVSEECAVAMAAGCRERFETDYALALTGIAGPDGGSDEKPVGTVWIGLATVRDKRAHRMKLGGLRAVIRERSVYGALEMLRREILDIK
ncbi:MAG: competence/damage-inducible protein A [candidate division Zixibacteria bacterium]|jgi:nicotinamide-nucleotide amidase|nr:competence/damage-inducible protein A [candidate division Zixibacteria bacterium]